MTAWVDGGRAAWGIRVQPYDVITYDIGNGKRAVGQVGDVYSHVGTGGRITEYHVHGVDFGNVIDINNGDDPQLASPELTAEFKAQRAEFNRRRNAPVIERGKAPSSAHQVPRSSFDEARRRICGPRVKPPRMDVLTMPIVPRPEDFASMHVAVNDCMRRIDHAMRPADHLMEAAIRMVFALGYQPSDCRIDILQGANSLDDGSVDVKRLVVRDAPCFEVAVGRSPMVDFKFTITVTPSLIAWPPDRAGVRMDDNTVDSVAV